MAMLRGGGLRAARESVDTGTGERRVDQGRAAHVGRGSFVNFYDDLGISTTAEGASKIRADEAKFQGAIRDEQKRLNEASSQAATAQGQLSKSKSQLDAAKSQIPGYSDALKKAWDQTQASFVPVRVVDPSGNKVEAVYRLPKSVIPSLQKSTAGFEQRFVDDGANYNISVKHESGRIRGQEIHDALRTAAQDVYGQFVKTASPSISKQLGSATGQLSDAYGSLSKQQAELDSAKSQIEASRGLLQGTKQQRADMWKDVRDQYAQKKKAIAEIFGNLNVEKGGKNG